MVRIGNAEGYERILSLRERLEGKLHIDRGIKNGVTNGVTNTKSGGYIHK